MYRPVFLLLSAVLLIALGSGLATSMDATQEPWVNQDGVVDLERQPAEMPLLDETGKVVGTIPAPGPPPPGPGKPEQFIEPGGMLKYEEKPDKQ